MTMRGHRQLMRQGQQAPMSRREEREVLQAAGSTVREVRQTGLQVEGVGALGELVIDRGCRVIRYAVAAAGDDPLLRVFAGRAAGIATNKMLELEDALYTLPEQF